MTVQVGLCQTCSETTLLVFPRDGSIVIVQCFGVDFYLNWLNLLYVFICERRSENYGSVYVHRVVALVGIISTLRLSICLVVLPNLDKLMSRCRVKMTQIDILSF